MVHLGDFGMNNDSLDNPPPETKVGDLTSKPNELNLARWSDRFFGWLIDFVIVTIAVEILFYATAFPLWFGSNHERSFRVEIAIGYVIRSLIFLAYWSYFESTTGQSIGKRILRLKTVGMIGEIVNIRNALIEGFGKSFLLPIDLIVGWIFTNKKRQRLLNRASNTIVIKLKSHTEESSGNVRYTKDY
jgi:uncharacterized RDD family membrane protein YckC